MCRTLADVRAELVRLRGEVIAAAAQNGCRIVAAGTHPFSRWEDQRVTPKERYRGLAKDYQQLREQIIFGCHVHVGIADRELAIRVMNRVRPWLATLLAVSGNSPFWLGVDTGYASYRTELFQRLPTVGTPQVLASCAEYDEVVASLIAIGLIEDGSKIYWDVRPSSRFETLEFRVADVCTTIDEAVMVAGLCRPGPRVRRAASCGASRTSTRGRSCSGPRSGTPRGMAWTASSSMSAARRAVAAGEQVEALLAFVRSSLEAAGDRDEVTATVRRVIEQGSGARRQGGVRAGRAAGRRHRHAGDRDGAGLDELRRGRDLAAGGPGSRPADGHDQGLH